MNINRNTSHPSAFISSTFLDLKEERRAVSKLLKECNLNVNALDIRPASNSKSKDEILKGIVESDFIILIIGQRYGSVIPEMTGSQAHSITKWEYLQAKLKGKSIIAFFKESTDKNLVDNQVSLDEFKNIVKRNHNPKYFSTIEELEHEVRRALIPIYRDGVASLLSVKDKLKNERDDLKQQIERLTHESKKSASGGILNPNVRGGLSTIQSGIPAGLLLHAVKMKLG
ncbi:MAG: DUF4062 domain-containing protein [Methylococcales bacterium]